MKRLLKLAAFILIASLAFIAYKIFLKKEEAGSSFFPLEKADKVLVLKSERKLHLIRKEKIFRTYSVALGRSPVGDKVKEGDNKTPEGNYTLDWRNSNSSCYKSLHISYPNKEDKARAKKLNVSPGGDVMIHGLHPSNEWMGKMHLKIDWTYGCVAVTNEEMDEIWKSVKNGTPIEIRK